jgi:UDP-N-acetylmuramoyl-tripeptide--D-alanyl-D-alanine ligase
VPLTLLGTPSNCSVAVIEMGASHPGEIAELCRLAKPDHGLVTSIGRAHLEGFGNIEVIAQTKGALYEYVARIGTAFVPTDDALCRQVSAANPRRIGYGFEARPADWSAEFVRGEKLTFDSAGCAHFQYEGTEIAMTLPGRPAALSALAALTVARMLGISAADCRETIQDWRGVNGRSGIIRLAGITLMDDSYNANPMSMRAALETLSFLPASRHVAILGDMNELGAAADGEHRSLGRDAAKSGLTLAMFVGRFAEIAAAECRAAGTEARSFADFEACDAEMAALIHEGDAVLVKGSRSMRLERAVQKLNMRFA